MIRQNYFVCPRCGQIHDADPKPSRETWSIATEQPALQLPEKRKLMLLDVGATRAWFQTSTQQVFIGSETSGKLRLSIEHARRIAFDILELISPPSSVEPTPPSQGEKL